MLFKTLVLSTLSVAPVASFGCYPAWRFSGDYSSGSMVSATRVVNATIGTWETRNFKCNSGSQSSLSHCPTYDPSNPAMAIAAWSDEGICDMSQPLMAPTPTLTPTHPRWSGAGCPNTWVDGATYKEGELATVNGVVYTCSSEPFVNTWCGNSNYKPGDSLYWNLAWTLLGSCDGTIAPTGSPNFVSLADAGGCPDEYASVGLYEEGDKVTMNNIVYQCRSWPNSAWCKMDGYEPDGVNSQDAWTRIGYCDGKLFE